MQGKQRSTLVKDAFNPSVLVIVAEDAECMLSGEKVTLKSACLEGSLLDGALHKSAAMVYVHYVLHVVKACYG